jgi:hypothetical protein
VPSTNPDGVGLSCVAHRESPCVAYYCLFEAFAYYSMQLVDSSRSNGYEPEGREFESLRAHHSFLPPFANARKIRHPATDHIINVGTFTQGQKLDRDTLESVRTGVCVSTVLVKKLFWF